jgi:hypothetical protein
MDGKQIPKQILKEKLSRNEILLLLLLLLVERTSAELAKR